MKIINKFFYKSFEIVNFVNLTEKEKKIILRWRNDKRVNHWMFESKKITLDEHLNFINNLETSSDKQYWIVKAGRKKYLGVIYLDQINFLSKTAYLGIYLAPRLIGKGKGIMLLDCLKYIAFEVLKLDKLMLEVFDFNKRAIAFYLKYGFIKEKNFSLRTKKRIRNNILIMGMVKNTRKKLEIAVLTSKKSWFIPYAESLVSQLRIKYNCSLLSTHKNVKKKFDIVFLLSYFRLVDSGFLSQNKHNVVVHESDLPKGKGWAPLFWQILEGKHKIPIVLFEVEPKMDSGDIYLKEFIKLKGNELHDQIRKIQADKTFELCFKFIELYKNNNLSRFKQKGKTTIYPRRTEKNSEMDINKTIKEQFNLLRVVDNKRFPAFFWYNKQKYILKIYKNENSKNWQKNGQ